VRRRWREALVLAAGPAAVLAALLWAWSPGADQAHKAGREIAGDWPAALETDAAANAAGLAGCVTDWECELAERAAIAAFEILCFEGKVPCIDRRKEVKK